MRIDQESSRISLAVNRETRQRIRHRRVTAAITAAFTTTLTAGLLLAAPGTAHAQDADRIVASGGITVAGWNGIVDPAAAANGAKITDARLAAEGAGLRVTTGPATTYWRPDERLTGNYTIRATFTELEYMALNNHPHPYGIVIAGNEMGSESQSLLYCTAYGNGRFIVRGFGPEPFQMNGPRPQEHDAVNRAAGPGQPVTQEIALSVRDDNIECAINGTVVARYSRADLVTKGRLASTDGVYGLRFGHNTDVKVTGLTVER
jgi:hypothetical protein